MGDKKKVYKVLVEKPEGRRPLGRPRRRCEEEIRMDPGEISLGEWIGLAQDRDQWLVLVSTEINLRVMAPRSYLLTYFRLPYLQIWRRCFCAVFRL
jgi:hypothetical protein